MKKFRSTRLTPALRRLFAPVRCLLLDVDGVLTDSTLYLGEGVEVKRFNVLDGQGIVLAQRVGLEIGFVSARASPATLVRARELGVRMVFHTTQNKLAIVHQVEQQLGIAPQNLCYVGDDVVDLPALRRVGVPVAVANAVDEVKAAAKYVTRHAGGDGAAREVIELILKAQDRWQQALSNYYEE